MELERRKEPKEQNEPFEQYNCELMEYMRKINNLVRFDLREINIKGFERWGVRDNLELSVNMPPSEFAGILRQVDELPEIRDPEIIDHYCRGGYMFLYYEDPEEARMLRELDFKEECLVPEYVEIGTSVKIHKYGSKFDATYSPFRAMVSFHKRTPSADWNIDKALDRVVSAAIKNKVTTEVKFNGVSTYQLLNGLARKIFWEEDIEDKDCIVHARYTPQIDERK